jgi:hypothetical protein
LFVESDAWLSSYMQNMETASSLRRRMSLSV